MGVYNAVVDQCHSGVEGEVVYGIRTYSRLTDALDGAPADSTAPYVIYIKSGRYHEKLVIAKPFITLLGQDRHSTILTFDDAAGTLRTDGTMLGTTGSASVTVRAPDLTVDNLTVENGFDYPANAAKSTDDPSRLANTQAVAFKTEPSSDRVFFRNVKFVGYQDTLYVDAGRHYFLDCTIAGHIDFIFGAGQAIFDDCDIISRDRGSATHNGYISAPSTHVSQPYGLLFSNCRLKKETPLLADGSVALGRPWHPTRDLPDGTRAADPSAVGSAVFMNCWMDAHISAQGWEPMSGRGKDGRTLWFYPADARFYEYGSTGPGAVTSDTRRVLSQSDARMYTAANVLSGWNPPG